MEFLMKEVKKGSLVKIHYSGRLEDGSSFDSTQGKKPLEFKVGGGQVFPAFENELIGLKEGDKKSFILKPEDAYGFSREELIVEVLRRNLPADLNPHVGQQIEIKQKKTGKITQAEIIRLAENSVTINANHPLADKTLHFDVEIVSIQ